MMPIACTRIIRGLLSCTFSFCILLTSFNASAQIASPIETVRSVVESILGILRTDGLSVEETQDQVKAEIFKAFDSRAMAQSVLSTNWRQASEEQQNEFEELFSQTLENTYIGRLETYTGETVEYRNEEIRNTRATVDTMIITSNVDIPVNYKLRLRSDGWFVYDVEVENVSMVSSYRETYRSIVRRSGIDGLLTQMRDKAAELTQ